MKRLIEFDLDGPADDAVRRAQLAREQVPRCGVALTGSDHTLLNLQNSQQWSVALGLLLDDGGQGVGAWRATSLAGGCLVDGTAEHATAAAEQVTALIVAAARMGAVRLTIPAAAISPDAPVRYAKALNRTYALITGFIPVLERHDMTLCLRAAYDGFLMSPPEMRELLDRFDSPFVAADVDLDCPRCDRADARDWLATLGPRVGVVGYSSMHAAVSVMGELMNAVAVERSGDM